MRRLLASVLLLAACNTASDLRKWYVALDGVARPARPVEEVVVLEHPPDASVRPFTVIGLIAPPPDAFLSYAEALTAVRRAAALHGADAVYVEAHDEVTRPTRAALEPPLLITIRAKAIVWRSK